MMSGHSSSPVMHDAYGDLSQNYLKVDIIQSLALVVISNALVLAALFLLLVRFSLPHVFPSLWHIPR
eukprot:COSAG05_NODE_1713_length_4230_cov_3.216897_5_plen_67_part_00